MSVLTDCNPLVICASFPRKPPFKFALICFTSFTRDHYSYMFIFMTVGDKKLQHDIFLKGPTKLDKMSWPLLLFCRLILNYHFILHKAIFQRACDFSILINFFKIPSLRELIFLLCMLLYNFLSYPMGVKITPLTQCLIRSIHRNCHGYSIYSQPRIKGVWGCKLYQLHSSKERQENGL